MTWLIARREIIERGRSRAFRISTAVLLLAIAAAVVIPVLLSKPAKPSRVGITGGPALAMTATVKEASRLTGTPVTIVSVPSVAAGETGIRDGKLDGLYVDGREVVIKQEDIQGESSGATLPGVLAQLGGLTTALRGVPASTIEALVSGQSRLPVRPLLPPSGSLASRLTGLFTGILLWSLIGTYGAQIAMGIGEEKSSRVSEVLLAAVRPMQLLTGKVLGIGLLGLGQVTAMAGLFLGLGYALGSSVVRGSAPGTVIAGLVFFLVGYAFYCTAYAAAGSLVSRQSEVGAVTFPMQIPLILAYVLSYTVLYVNGANVFYRILGFLPPTSPVAMPVLYAAGDVPWWQVAVSAALCAAATAWMTRVASGIYARSILRTGARVRLREALRS